MRCTLACILLVSALAFAQQDCPVPPGIEKPSHEIDIFSDEQEVDLGDALAEQIAFRTTVINDDHLTMYLRGLGERIVQHLPPNNMKFRFYLVELPEVNAFSIAGGRVYTSRKMVALAQSDDELAGVIAHELGHILAHQSAIFVTQRFREVLGVTAVKDRTDIFEKYHLFVENVARKPSRVHGPNEDKEQYVADQIALYAMARAGYAPHAFIDMWDRFQRTHGKTGSWFSDLFGSTKPSERRLREMMRDVKALPPGCADMPSGTERAEFAKWQTEVINYSGTGSKESLPGLLSKQTLALPLRPDLGYVHFSPDGKYILAQDEGGIHVLTRNPLASLFYIPAVDAQHASFSPDSQSLVFDNRALRVEKWSIADQKQVSVHELTLSEACMQTALSPDASTLACLDTASSLQLFDVATGSTLATKKNFYVPTFSAIFRMLTALTDHDSIQLVAMSFSPDGRYFLAGSRGTHFAWDAANRREINLPGSIRSILTYTFAFVGNDRILGAQESNPQNAVLLRFPSGEHIENYPHSASLHFGSVGRGNYVLVDPLNDFFIGILDLKTKTFPVAAKQPAIDIFDETVLRERINGELSLEDLATKQTSARLRLPQARLGTLRAAAVSPDLEWLAISTKSRGAVWDLVHNIRTQHVRGFRGAWYGDDHAFYVDIAAFEKSPRAIARLETLTGFAQEGRKLSETIAEQQGRYVILTKPKDNPGLRRSFDAEVEIRDVRDDHVVWTRHFPRQVPAFSLSRDEVLLSWPLSEAGGQEAIQQFPELKRRSEKGDYICEVVDLAKNASIGKFLVKSNKNSFKVEGIWLAGDWAVVPASDNQILTYSISSGEEKGHFFGTNPVPSSAFPLLAVDSETSHVKLYDLATSQLRQEYEFPEPVAIKRFSADGTRMLVLTVGQTVYILNVTGKAATQSDSLSSN